jgi:hypothetical protein
LVGLIDSKAPSNPKATATTQMANKQEPVSKKVKKTIKTIKDAPFRWASAFLTYAKIKGK